MNKLIITTIIVFAFLGCNTKKEETGQQNKVNQLADGELLSFNDSLQIKLADKLTFIESHEDKLLFHATRYGIILTDLTGNKIHDFNPVGGADNEIGYQIKQICFTGTGNIAIASERGIFVYTQAGKFVSKMNKKFPYNSLDKGMYLFDENSEDYYITNVLIEPENFSINMSPEEYFNTMRLKMLHNFKSGESEFIGLRIS